jgi:tRNA1Val (adenine37-N6)-methyltransferase
MDETLDAIFDGRIKVCQSRSGYRFSLDSLLLADFTGVERGASVVDLGAGNGIVPLILATRCPMSHFLGVELQDGMVERARRNVRLNHVQDRVEIVQGNVRAIERIARPVSFDVAVANPPFRKSTSGRISAGDERRIARHETEGALADFVRAAAYLLCAKGRFNVVYPAVRSIDLLTAMRESKIEPKRIRLVHSFVEAAATLVLAEGVKGGRSGVDILAPLIVYTRDKKYTDEAAAIIAGSRYRKAG